MADSNWKGTEEAGGGCFDPVPSADTWPASSTGCAGALASGEDQQQRPWVRSVLGVELFQRKAEPQAPASTAPTVGETGSVLATSSGLICSFFYGKKNACFLFETQHDCC